MSFEERIKERKRRRREFLEKFMKGEVVVIGTLKRPRRVMKKAGDFLKGRQEARLRRIEERKEREKWIRDHEEEFIEWAGTVFEDQTKKRIEARMRRIKRLEKIGDLAHEEAEKMIRALKEHLERVRRQLREW